METKRVRRLVMAVGLVLIAAIVGTGCKKNDDPKPGGREKISVKVTATVTGADLNDQARFAVQAGNDDGSQYGVPVWKINGVAQGNESHVYRDEESFATNVKTYVFETINPVEYVFVNTTLSNTGGAPFTVSYKVEVNGAVQTNVENKVFNAGQSEIKDYTYKK